MKRTILLAGAALIGLGGAVYAQDNPAAPTNDPMQQTMPPAAPPPADVTAPDAVATPTAPATASPTDTGTTSPTTATEGTVGTGTTTDTTTGTTATGTDAATNTTTAGAAAGGTASANVQADWAKYDPENTGSLTPLQFGKWILASRGQDMSAQVDKTVHSKASNLPAVKVLNATASEFVKADTDKDHKVSQAELTAYLSA